MYRTFRRRTMLCRRTLVSPGTAYHFSVVWRRCRYNNACEHGRRHRGGGDRSPANFLALNIMPMDVAWKESTSNDSRPLQSSRRGAALACEFAARHLTKLQGWRNDSRGGGGGTRPWGPSRKRVPKCLKGPQNHLYN